MRWENQGTWHIDHRIPVSAFDMTNPVEQKAAFHYTNLQSMWGSGNIKKRTATTPRTRRSTCEFGGGCFETTVCNNTSRENRLST
jgi:hypothetical protein